MSSLNVVLVGGGNSTLCLAPLVAHAGHKVFILTRRPQDWSKTVTMINEDKNYIPEERLECVPEKITDDPAEVVPLADVVWLAGVPIHHNPELLRKIKPHLNPEKKVFVGSICTYGGFDWVAKRELEGANYSLFGAQLIPWCCGTAQYGSVGVIYGAKRFLRVVTPGGEDPDNVKPFVSSVLRQRVEDIDFLSSTLWPNNPSIHPPILYGLFKDWDGVSPFKPESVPVLIYKEMTEESAVVTENLCQELQAIVKALSNHFPHNKSLRYNFELKHCILENYEDQVLDRSSLLQVFRTCTAYAKHKVPYKQVEGGVVPIIQHKFFETDLPYGLVTFKDIALMVNVPTPTIDALILWNQKLVEKEFLVDGKLTGKDMPEAITPTQFGLTLDDLAPAATTRSESAPDADAPPAKKIKADE
eukprot:c12985_g1_i1.p1 GENE.c12985_g1_i1~~c12985_g1_i1.p1  ORF type:complete len:416 (+),score=78.41 c12985_g1_i1:41-1288(+)